MILIADAHFWRAAQFGGTSPIVVELAKEFLASHQPAVANRCPIIIMIVFITRRQLTRIKHNNDVWLAFGKAVCRWPNVNVL